MIDEQPGLYAVIRQISGKATPLLLSNTLNGVVGTIVFFFVARFVTPAEFGAYAALLGVVQFSLAALSGGLSTWVTRHLSTSAEDAPELIAVMVRWHGVLLLVLPLAVMLVAASIGLRSQLVLAGTLGAGQAVARSVAQAVSSYLMATGQLSRIARSNMVEALLTGVLVVSFVAAGLGVVGLALGGMLAASGKAWSIWFDTKRDIKVDIRRSDVAMGALLRSSAPLWMTQVIYALGARLQPVAVGFGSPVLAGFYVVSLRFVDSSQLLISPLVPVLLPMLSRDRDNPLILRNRVVVASGLVSVMALFVGAGLVIFREEIVRLFLGEQYLSVIPAMPFIALMVLTSFLAQICSTALIALGMEGFIVKTVGITAVVLLAGLTMLSLDNHLSALVGFSVVTSSVNLAVWGIMIWHKTREIPVDNVQPGTL